MPAPSSAFENEQAASPTGIKRALAFVNPRSGTCSFDQVCESLTRIMTAAGVEVEIREPVFDVAQLAREIETEIASGSLDLVVAAGGDGTVSSVANALIGKGIPLGVIPLGTANVLSLELGIPTELDAACRILVESHELRAIDVMQVKGKHYLTQLGVGIDSLMIRDTDSDSKRKFGKLAYLWSATRWLIGFQPRRFDLMIDGAATRVHASEVVVANTGMMGRPSFRWGPGISPDDGILNICVVKARTLLHYLTLFLLVASGRHHAHWSVRYFPLRQNLTIATKRPLPVQADGEIIGETPVTIEIVPQALQLVVPHGVPPTA